MKKRSAPREALQHIEDYKALEKKLGAILADVRNIFFSLSQVELDKLLHEYGVKHTQKARNYASETYPLWKSGRRKMSGQTAERLLNLIPPRLSFGERYLLVKKLCYHCAKKVGHSVTVYTEDPSESLKKLKNTLNQCSSMDSIKFLPKDIIETMRWLNNNDMVAARMLIAEVDKEIYSTTVAIALDEFEVVSRVVRNKMAKNATHVIELPAATITVRIERPRQGILARIIESIFGG